MLHKEDIMQTNKYSLFINILKKTLFVILLIAIIILLLMPVFSNKNQQLEVNSTVSKINEIPSLTMSGIELNSWMSKIGKYEIKASKLIQLVSGSIKMDRPILLLNQLKNPVNIKSNFGEVFDNQQLIKMFDDVVVRMEKLKNTLFMKTSEMIFNNKKSIITSNKKTHVIYGKSDFFSDSGFITNLDQKDTNFTGPITGKIILENNKKILFNSDTLKGNWLEQNIYLIGNAKIKFSDLIIIADQFESQINKKTNSFEKIYFMGNIKFTSKKQTIFCDNGVYDVKSNIITLSNNVELLDNDKKINSDKFIYLVNKGYGYIPKKKNTRVKAKIKLKNK